MPSAIEVFGEGKVEQFRHGFASLDKDHDGFITAYEIPIVMRTVGLSPSEAEIQEFISDAQRRGGKVDVEVFLEYCAQKGPDTDRFDDLIQFFTPFDPLNTGMVSEPVFRNLMTNVGEVFTHEEVDEMIRDVCAGSEMINYREFVSTIMQV